MSEQDEALLLKCDEAVCLADPMFPEFFDIGDRWGMIRAVLSAAEAYKDAQKTAEDTEQ